MNKFFFFIALAITMLPTHVCATQNQSTAEPSPIHAAQIAVQAGSISIDVKNKRLCDVMQEIHARSGAEVTVPQHLAGDMVSRSAQGSTWQAVIGHLLDDYNYRAVWGKSGQPLQLTLYGRNKNTDESAPALGGASEDLLIYETYATLPQKFQGLNPGSVAPVSLPIERLKEMAVGKKINLTLPCGQFTVVYDNRFQNKNGDVTWAGYLENADKQYRIIVTLGGVGVLGQVVTPNGIYNLDFADGRTWLVDASPVGADSPKQIASVVVHPFNS